MDVIKKLFEDIRAKPLEWTEAVRLTLIVLPAFGVWHMTPEQQAVLLAAISGWLTLIARGQTVSHHRVDQKVEEQVLHREISGQTGTGVFKNPITTSGVNRV